MLNFKDRRLVDFGQRVKNIRESKGMSLNDIIQNTSLNKATIIAIEEGSKNFAFTTLLELAKGLGVEPATLLELNIEG